MQEGKNWILPKEINANRFFSETLISWKCIYGTEWREHGYGLGISQMQVGKNLILSK
jgi:hypothetical protein